MKYLQGMLFTNETEIKNFVTATPDSGIFQSSSMRIQPYVTTFKPAIYVKHNWWNNCAERNALLDLLISHIQITALALL